MDTKFNAKLWGEYHYQQMDIADAMFELKIKNGKWQKQSAYCHELFEMWLGSDDTYPEFFTERNPVHYIACGGMHGCISNFCASLDDYDSAVDYIAEIHDLTPIKIARLRRDGYIELYLPRDGNEYAEIIECDCDDPDSHNDY